MACTANKAPLFRNVAVSMQKIYFIWLKIKYKIDAKMLRKCHSVLHYIVYTIYILLPKI